MYFKLLIIFLNMFAHAEFPDFVQNDLKNKISTLNRINNPYVTSTSCLAKPIPMVASQCPPYLLEMVFNPFEDRSAGLIKSRVNECYTDLESDKFNVSRNYKEFKTADDIQKAFEKSELSKLGEFSHSVAKACVRDKKYSQHVVVSRFYSMAAKFNNASAQVARDLVRIHRLLKDESEITCPNPYITSDAFDSCLQEQKCPDQLNLKKLAEISKSDFELLEKSKKRLAELGQKCNQSSTCQKEKESLSALIAGLLKRNPWFLDNHYIAQKKFSEEKRLEFYFKRTREQLKNYLSQLEMGSACLHYPEEKKCDIEDLRELTENIPAVVLAEDGDLNTKKLNVHLKFQQCVDRVSIDRDQTSRVVNAPVQILGEFLITAPLGVGIASTSAKAGKLILPRLMALLGAEASINFVANPENWKSFEKSCINKNFTLVGSNPSQNQNNSCQAEGSIISQRQFEEGNCLVDSSLAALSLLPMVQTAAQVSKVVQRSNSAAQAAQVTQATENAVVITQPLIQVSSTASTTTTTVSRILNPVERRSDVAATNERRLSSGRNVDSITALGSRELPVGIKSKTSVQLSSISNKPSEIEISEVTKIDGRKTYTFETLDRLANGNWVRTSKEFLIDSVSGGIDATSPSGRELFEKMALSKAGKAHFAFFDVGSLGAVNRTFKAGEEAGDRYLKGVAEKILKEGDGKVTLARTGGDEFGLIIDEKDPQKVKEILSRIQAAIKSDLKGDAKKIFFEEKVERAQDFKTALEKLMKENPSLTREQAIEMVRAPLDEVARVSVPDVSIGSAQIGSKDSLASLSERAESSAKSGKIQTALQHGRSAEKYGSKETPRSRPNPLYRAPIEAPVPSPSWNIPAIPPPLSPADARPMNFFRGTEVVRFGDITVAEYADELGRKIYRTERYYTDPVTKQKTPILTDIPTKGSSGLLDGTHPEGQDLLIKHFTSGNSKQLVMPKLRSLKYLNYFESGTQAGDEVLAVLGDIIKSKSRQGDINFKMNGADFLWSANELPASTLSQRFQDITKDLQAHPRIKDLFSKEEAALRAKISEYQASGQTAKASEYQKRLVEIQNFNFDLQFEVITRKDVPAQNGDVNYKRIQKVFDDRFKNRNP